MPPSILNLFLTGDDVEELAPALSRVGLVLQYRQDRPTSPLKLLIKTIRKGHFAFPVWPKSVTTEALNNIH